MKKNIFIVLFIDHLLNKRETVHVASSYVKADSFCSNFSIENPEYKLKKNPKNKNHWIGDSYNYNLIIESHKLDKDF